jgi:hypothetical protein
LRLCLFHIRMHTFQHRVHTCSNTCSNSESNEKTPVSRKNHTRVIKILHQLRIGFCLFRRYVKGNLRSRRPCIHIPLTHRHRHVRFEWTIEHTRLTMQHWRHVLFTDEKRFCLDFTDRRARVWKRQGCKYCRA